jgi:uncharacterized membrane protein
MKFSAKAIAALTMVALLFSGNPAFAATGGRISGNRFGSYSSGGSPSSRSSSRPSNSYTYSTPTPQITVPSTPSSRRDYDDDYYYNRRSSGSSIIVLPSIVAPVAPVIPEVPATLSTPTVQATPPVKPPSTTESVSKPSKPSDSNPLSWILLLAAAGVIAYLLASKNEVSRGEDSMTLSHVQVALLASAKDVQDDLLNMAESGDTDSSEGLNNILKETTLALMRHPDLAVYAYGETFTGSPEEVEARFNKKSIEERSKVSEELITNELGRVKKSVSSIKETGENEYILVSLVVASEPALKVVNPESWSDVRGNLVTLGSISSGDLVALEIIWQPEDKDVLSQEELISLYPNLVRI